MAERPAQLGSDQSSPEPLDNETVRAIVAAEITSAIGYLDGTIARERSNALKYYRGELFGNEIDGRSKVVMSDVQDTVEWIMPSLLRIFMSGSTACKFQPTGPEDEESAKQKTDYANHVIFTENDGYSNLYAWLKDGLLQKNGILKVFWDEQEKRERSKHTGLTETELMYMLQQPEEGEIDVVESREYEGEASGQIVPVLDEMGQAVLDEFGSPIMAEAPPPILIDVTLERTWVHKQIRTEPVPPEEFIISREARSMAEARMKGHRMRKTVSWGIEHGFDRDQLISLSETGANFGLLNREYIERRHQEYEYPRTGAAIDEATREIVIVECYLHLDVNGDGHSELVQVYVGGDSHEILTRDGEPAIEQIDVDQPFVDWTPIMMPHVFFGRSMYDLVGDIQLIRSTLLRQVLDNSYGLNNNRVAVSNKVDLDDLLNQRPDGVIRIDTDGADAAAHIAPLPVQPLGSYVFPIMEFMETVSEKRTGVIRLNQGLDAETLDDTASGQAKLMAQANQRIELIARTFAETGMRRLFDMVCRLSVAHQDKAKTVRLRNKWVNVDPRTWTTEYNITAEVGLGYDSREMEAFAIERLLQKYETIVPIQGGVDGPLVTLPKIRNALDRYTSALGLKEPDDYWEDPNSPEMQQLVAQQKQSAAAAAQQPDPALALAQGQIQTEQARVQQDAQKAAAEDQFRRDQLASQERIKIAEIEARTAIEREKIAASMNETAAKIEADASRLRQDAILAREKIEAESFNKELDRQTNEVMPEMPQEMPGPLAGEEMPMEGQIAGAPQELPPEIEE